MIAPNAGTAASCCKLMHAEIPEEDIDRDAALLGMTREQFIQAHLKQDCGEWLEFHQPCGFLSEDGSCRLGDYRPDSCKKFPYTDQPERLYSLYSFLNAVGVCPAAYEICEALKTHYGFRRGRGRSPQNDPLCESIDGFSFVAGHTSWGFPYGIEESAEDAETFSGEALPF